ncbi:NAD-dependent epimerase/dehydratase family protein [Kineococcus aurantiacus]|uniref:Nucleoside-diphosphate-sugar epimerase n=1 Tax=Kineococcus aurantiacus TaxID=37633 RepID=A0A7Y9J240_9ACTN|nr:NAD-dependent epimerase/dehydratase family protein [Kineococcus aurantiacus]NYD23739.1 nucleoside-diphosphate-sugar epimerase [Kineococcus aurantiacus]
MKVAITGASGNVGTALLRRLAADGVEVVGICRRLPEPVGVYADVRWESLDVAGPGAVDRLAQVFAGVDAVVHTAWLIQPARDPQELTRVNVSGTRNVVQAALRAGVPHLVHLSSVGAYATHPIGGGRVDESWPAAGITPSQYSREKATVEARLDEVERDHPELVVTRVRPALVFQRDSGSEIARYFLGALVPTRLLRRVPLPVLPVPQRLRFQVVHADDLADALARILDVVPGGAFNVADEPLLTGRDLALALNAARFRGVDRRLVRALAALTYHARLHPVQPGWLDLGYGVPVMDTTRAREVLGWRPAHAARDVLVELVEGMRDHAGTPSAALRRRTGLVTSRTGT